MTLRGASSFRCLEFPSEIGRILQENWCCQTGLNCRPLHYQWSALPLSYGSMPDAGISPQKAPQGGRSLPQGHGSRNPSKSRISAGSGRFLLQSGQLRADSVPHLVAKGLQRLDRADHDLEFGHFASRIELDQIDALELPFADICTEFQPCIMRAGDEAAVVAKILENCHHRGQYQQGGGAAGD